MNEKTGEPSWLSGSSKRIEAARLIWQTPDVNLTGEHRCTPCKQIGEPSCSCRHGKHRCACCKARRIRSEECDWSDNLPVAASRDEPHQDDHEKSESGQVTGIEAESSKDHVMSDDISHEHELRLGRTTLSQDEIETEDETLAADGPSPEDSMNESAAVACV